MEPASPSNLCISVPSSARISTSGLFNIVVDSQPNNIAAEWPPYATPHKIAIIGSEPTKDDLQLGIPLSTTSGSLLFDTLRRIRNINRADCYINLLADSVPDKATEKRKNVLQRPGLAQRLDTILADLSTHNPNVILLVGQLALDVAFPGQGRSITEWRGSILKPTSGPFAGYKIIPCLTPMSVFIKWDLWPLFRHDLERFAFEIDSPDVNVPDRRFDIMLSADQCIERLAEITDIPTPVALDIEGGCNGMTCVSFSPHPLYAFIVPFACYSLQDKIKTLRAIAKFCWSSTPKVLQNQLYDNFVLSYTYRLPIRNVVHDTMLSGWEIYPELPKGLGTQVSIWTREPFYKVDRKIALRMSKERLAKVSSSEDDDDEEASDLGYIPTALTSSERDILHRYCCKDSACTLEIALAHDAYLKRQPMGPLQHFRFNMELLPALLYLQLRGIRYDRQAANLLTTQFGGDILRIQTQIDNYVESVWIRHGSRGPKPASVNLNSPKQLAELLYVRLGYPKQHPKKGREVDTTRVTTGIDALLELRKRYNGPDDDILEHILQFRKATKLSQATLLRTDKDGRIRCSFNLVGTETGRLGCRKSATGSGANLTTITKSLRRLYIADDQKWFFQCDLAGADGWTVAAHCALQGDPTMLDDYLFGLKPAKIIVLLLRGYNVASMSREEIATASKLINEDDALGWQYFACKCVQHGSNYGLGKDKMSQLILKNSYKLKGRTYVVSPQECVRMQDLYFSRYRGVKMWQEYIRQTLNTTAQLPCASGHIRTFFGRRKDHATHAEGFSHEPQANTTYATNLALHRLWTDPDNRINIDGKIRLRVEPLHHVHDALCGQFYRADVEFAVSKIRSWFNNPLTIAGRTITIPFEGQYGPSWGCLGPKYGGGNI